MKEGCKNVKGVFRRHFQKNEIKKSLYKLVHRKGPISKKELLSKFQVPKTTITRMIYELEQLIGNIYGIALNAFKSRIKGKKIEKTNLFYEVKMIMSIIPLLPAALIHAFISNLFKVAVLDFDGKQSVKTLM